MLYVQIYQCHKPIQLKDKPIQLKDKLIQLKDKPIQLKDKLIQLKDKPIQLKKVNRNYRSRATRRHTTMVSVGPHIWLPNTGNLVNFKRNVNTVALIMTRQTFTVVD
jgi:hypothetical protein